MPEMTERSDDTQTPLVSYSKEGKEEDIWRIYNYLMEEVTCRYERRSLENGMIRNEPRIPFY
jgi:hypothetical protein